MATTPGVVIQNYIGRRMPTGCTNDTLEGVYGLNGAGTVLSTNSLGLPGGPLTSMATAYFDGLGNFRKENEEDLVNGRLFSIDKLTGSYSVNADCTFSITATSPYSFTFSGLIVDDGKSIDLLPTKNGELVETLVGKKIAH